MLLGHLNVFFSASSRLLINNRYFGSFKSLAYQSILRLSSCYCNKLSNVFVSPGPELPITNILYGWSGIYGYFWMIFIVFMRNILRIKCFCMLLKLLIHVSYKEEKKQKRLFQKLSFYDALIEKPHIKHLKI